MELESLKAEVAELKELQIKGGREPIYVPGNDTIKTLEQNGNYNVYSNGSSIWYMSSDMVWFPEFNGFVSVGINKKTGSALSWSVANFAALQNTFQQYATSSGFGGDYFRRLWLNYLKSVWDTQGFINFEIPQYIADAIASTNTFKVDLPFTDKPFITVTKGQPVFFSIRNSANTTLQRNFFDINIYGKIA